MEIILRDFQDHMLSPKILDVTVSSRALNSLSDKNIPPRMCLQPTLSFDIGHWKATQRNFETL